MPMAFEDFLTYSRCTQDEMPLYLFDKHFGKTTQLANDYEVTVIVSAFMLFQASKDTKLGFGNMSLAEVSHGRNSRVVRERDDPTHSPPSVCCSGICSGYKPRTAYKLQELGAICNGFGQFQSINVKIHQSFWAPLETGCWALFIDLHATAESNNKKNNCAMSAPPQRSLQNKMFIVS